MQAEMTKRRKGWKRPEPNIKEGYMARYAAMVTGAASGAVFRRHRRLTTGKAASMNDPYAQGQRR